MGASWQRFSVEIPKTIKKTSDKLALGEEIIEHIRKRTESGKNNRGSSFPSYSKDYMKSLDFKISGKSSKVNLTQTGDMLADIEVLSIRGDKILIGFENGSESNDKADGHITGWQGRSKTKRPFLGFEGKEVKNLESIIKKHEKSAVGERDESLKYFAWLSARKKSKI